MAQAFSERAATRVARASACDKSMRPLRKARWENSPGWASLQTATRVAEMARDLGMSDQTIYVWRRQERIDRGLVPGLTSVEREELAAAKRRIRELEAELEIHRRASELLAEHSDPKGGSRPSR